MIGVEDENPIERALDDEVHHIFLGRNTEGHAQEIARIGQLVARIDEGLADRIFIRHRRDRRHLRDQPVAGDHALVRIVDLRSEIVIEGRQRPDDAAHHRHRVRVAAEAAIKGRELFVEHRVARDRIVEIGKLLRVRQLAVQQQIADLHEAGIFGKIADRIAAVEEHSSSPSI